MPPTKTIGYSPGWDPNDLSMVVEEYGFQIYIMLQEIKLWRISKNLEEYNCGGRLEYWKEKEF